MADPVQPARPVFIPAVSPADRPLSPHLQIWGWTVTMASSILQRATGIALYAGYTLLVIWLGAAALSEAAYQTVQGLLGSPFGLFILFGFTWAQMYHLCKGVLHLIWDSGHLLGKQQGKQAATLVIVLSVVLTAAIWALALGLKG